MASTTPLLEVRSIEGEAHSASSNETCRRNRDEPTQDDQKNTLPVDRPQATVAQSNTDSSSSDTHGGGNW